MLDASTRAAPVAFASLRSNLGHGPGEAGARALERDRLAAVALAEHVLAHELGEPLDRILARGIRAVGRDQHLRAVAAARETREAAGAPRARVSAPSTTPPS